jgi:HK97 family phage portal protein
MNPFIKAIAGNTIVQESEKAVEAAEDRFKIRLDQTVKSALDTAKKEWAKETAKDIVQEVQKKQYVTTTGNRPRTFEAKEVPINKSWSTLEQLYSNAPGSVQCVDRIRDSVLGSGYTLEKVEGEEATKKDLKTLIKFFDNPNPDETIEDIVGNGIINYLEYGSWFLEEVPTKRGDKLAEIYNLDSTKINILVDEEKRKAGINIISGYERTTETGTRVVYNAEEVTFIKRPDPRGLVWGKAVLEDNEATLQLLIQALIYNINILKNGGRPPLQLILPDDSDEADAEAVNVFWEKNYTGPENAGKTLITFKGAKASPLGITPQDMRYLNLLQYGIRAVAGQFGVPLIIIGIPEGTNRATASEVRRQFYLSKIFPLRDMIAKRITREVIKERFGVSGWKFTFKSAGLEESEATRRDTMTAWTKGLMSWNDARIKTGLEPLDEEWARKYFLLGSKNDSLIEIKNAILDVSPSKVKKPKGKAPDSQGVGGPQEPGQGADMKPA